MYLILFIKKASLKLSNKHPPTYFKHPSPTADTGSLPASPPLRGEYNPYLLIHLRGEKRPLQGTHMLYILPPLLVYELVTITHISTLLSSPDTAAWALPVSRSVLMPLSALLLPPTYVFSCFSRCDYFTVRTRCTIVN